jgi:hypothetical protein
MDMRGRAHKSITNILFSSDTYISRFYVVHINLSSNVGKSRNAMRQRLAQDKIVVVEVEKSRLLEVNR